MACSMLPLSGTSLNSQPLPRNVFLRFEKSGHFVQPNPLLITLPACGRPANGFLFGRYGPVRVHSYRPEPRQIEISGLRDSDDVKHSTGAKYILMKGSTL